MSSELGVETGYSVVVPGDKVVTNNVEDQKVKNGFAKIDIDNFDKEAILQSFNSLNAKLDELEKDQRETRERVERLQELSHNPPTRQSWGGRFDVLELKYILGWGFLSQMSREMSSIVHRYLFPDEHSPIFYYRMKRVMHDIDDLREDEDMDDTCTTGVIQHENRKNGFSAFRSIPMIPYAQEMLTPTMKWEDLCQRYGWYGRKLNQHMRELKYLAEDHAPVKGAVLTREGLIQARDACIPNKESKSRTTLTELIDIWCDLCSMKPQNNQAHSI